MVRERNLHNFVRYLGELPNGELRKYFYLADLFVLLTHKDKEREEEEAFGLVFLEAATAGLPVVAGASGAGTHHFAFGSHEPGRLSPAAFVRGEGGDTR